MVSYVPFVSPPQGGSFLPNIVTVQRNALALGAQQSGGRPLRQIRTRSDLEYNDQQQRSANTGRASDGRLPSTIPAWLHRSSH